jgi:hypothetical protein
MFECRIARSNGCFARKGKVLNTTTDVAARGGHAVVVCFATGFTGFDQWLTAFFEAPRASITLLVVETIKLGIRATTQHTRANSKYAVQIILALLSRVVHSTRIIRRLLTV